MELLYTMWYVYLCVCVCVCVCVCININYYFVFWLVGGRMIVNITITKVIKLAIDK